MANGSHTIWCLTDSFSYWTAQSKFADTQLNAVEGGLGFGFDRLSVIWSRPTQDDVEVNFSFAKQLAGAAITTLDPATDMPGVEANLDTWWTAIKGFISSDLVLKEYTWHEFKEGAQKPGPAIRTTLKSVPGTNGGFRAPDQDAVTASLRTSSRRHWGRIFLPGLTVNACSLGGFISQSSVVDPFAAAMNALWTSYHSSPGILLGVSSIKFQAFLTLDSLVVDNIWDVQRRRRLKHPTYEKTYV